ncbi:hypothetical protein, partial [Nesterenkonia sp.]|uniref:hypothetical protein n=1 Tax=Nesterenkonia sp. TaxID=704201 RepID=UPI002624923E
LFELLWIRLGHDDNPSRPGATEPDQLSPIPASAPTDEQYRSFQATVEATVVFAEKLHAAREARTDDTSTGGTVPVRGHLRAL